MKNITAIQERINNVRSVTILTSRPKHEKRLKLENPLTESSIVFRGTIPINLVEICEECGYRRTSKL